MEKTAEDKFWKEGHGKSRTQIEAECLIIPSGVGQVARQQYQIHFSERPEGAYSRCHCPTGNRLMGCTSLSYS